MAIIYLRPFSICLRRNVSEGEDLILNKPYLVYAVRTTEDEDQTVNEFMIFDETQKLVRLKEADVHIVPDD